MKKDNKKELVEYNPMVLMKNFIICQLLILYITLGVGDVLSTSSELGNALTRYIPVALVTLVSAFIIFKKNISKCLLKDKEDVKQKVILSPIIVAVILLGYGLYSVESNMSSIRSELNSSSYSEYSIYTLFMSEEEITQTLTEAAKLARKNWIITSIVYLLVAEFVAVSVNRKLEDWLKEESVYKEAENNNNTTTLENFEEQERFKEEVPLNNIKWDL